MSKENVEIVRKLFDAYSRGDLQGMLDHLAPEIEFRPSGTFMDMQRVYRGPDGWVEFDDTFRAAWESITISVERVEDLGKRCSSWVPSMGGGARAVSRSHASPRGFRSSVTASLCRFWRSRAGKRPSKPPGCRASWA